MPWYLDRSVVFPILAVLVILFVFHDYLPGYERLAGKLRVLRARILRRPMMVRLEVSEEAYARLEQMRVALSELSGKEATFDDVLDNAVRVYGDVVEAHDAGSEMVLRKPDGTNHPWHPFLEPSRP